MFDDILEEKIIELKMPEPEWWKAIDKIVKSYMNNDIITLSIIDKISGEVHNYFKKFGIDVDVCSAIRNHGFGCEVWVGTPPEYINLKVVRGVIYDNFNYI
jgi:hypothetical protein